MVHIKIKVQNIKDSAVFLLTELSCERFRNDDEILVHPQVAKSLLEKHPQHLADVGSQDVEGTLTNGHWERIGGTSSDSVPDTGIPAAADRSMEGKASKKKA